MNMKNTVKKFAQCLTFAAGLIAGAAHAAPAETLVQRGAYLARAGDCIACHLSLIHI